MDVTSNLTAGTGAMTDLGVGIDSQTAGLYAPGSGNSPPPTQLPPQQPAVQDPQAQIPAPTPGQVQQSNQGFTPDQVTQMFSQLMAQQQQPQQQQQGIQLAELDEVGQQFADTFQQFSGMDRETFAQAPQMIQQQAQQIADLQRQIQLMELRNDWGENYEQISNDVQGYLNQLSPTERQTMNNPQGVRLIAQALQAQQAMQQQQQQMTQPQPQQQPSPQPAPQQPQAPAFDRSNVNQASRKAEPELTLADIEKMSDGQIAKNYDKVLAAFAGTAA